MSVVLADNRAGVWRGGETGAENHDRHNAD